MARRSGFRAARARGGILVNIEWREGALVAASLVSPVSQECTIIHAPKRCRVINAAGQEVRTDRKGHRLTFEMHENGNYRLLG